MEKNNHPSHKQQNTTICEKLIRVIRTTSPFKATHFESRNKIHDEIPSTPSQNIYLMTNALVKDRCIRIPNQSTPLRDRCPRPMVDTKTESDQLVHIIFRESKDENKPENPKTNAPSKVLPIHGIEHRIPTMSNVVDKSSIAESINGLFSEYIDRAGRKIRSPTIVDGTNNIRDDSFNDKVSNFINGAKHKFYNTPSLVDSSSKEKRMK
ncbi:hypothetical protein RND81_04G075300 [Saponaria officinalis]|uniref:Uncharacterized protein n=1 Tax=Saponaria officinalis TaxID=3572 RepID=A0AAW1KV94_SAPOF